MPRVTYADRFDALLTRPLSMRDRRFCESLQSFYKRKGRLTPGRARCVRQLEDRYDPQKLAKAAERGSPMLQRLNALLTRVEGNQWATGFITSLMQQATTRDLSPKQIAMIEKIESENSDAAIAARTTWQQDYHRAGTDSKYPNHTPREIMIIAAQYYKTSGYYADLVERVLHSDNAGFTPSLKQYTAMTGNKYAQKVIDAHFAPAKYETGSFVLARSTAPYAVRNALATRPAVVLKADAAAVTSAARGVKKYSILPFGSPRPILVEERHIKAARGL
jgi:hypothetical protein